MKFLSVLTSVACLIAPLAAHAEATSCPPEKSLYAFEAVEENGTGPTYRVVYKVHPQQGKLRKPADEVSFETWRDGKLVWAIGGEVFCSDVVPMCNLTLDRLKKPRDVENAEACEKFPVFVETIPHGEDVQYVAFGGLAAYTMACGDGLDIRVKAKDQFSELEREANHFMLPPYVRFEACKD